MEFRFGDMDPPVLVEGKEDPQLTPAAADQARPLDWLMLTCTVTAEGRVIDCEFIPRWSAPHPLDDELLAALMQRRYRPAFYQGHSQAVRYSFGFRFRCPAGSAAWCREVKLGPPQH